MSEHTYYVCGFVFDSTCNNVALMRMARGPNPTFVGSLNGMGGKITHGSARQNMSRIFEAQAGRTIPPHEWHLFHRETMMKQSPLSTVYYLAAKADMFASIKAAGDEPVVLAPADAHSRSTFLVGHDESLQEVLNLSYLIPMAQHWLMYPHLRFTN